MRISDWSSDVCSSDLVELRQRLQGPVVLQAAAQAGDQGVEARPAAGGCQGAAGVIGDELGPEGLGRLDDGRNVSGSLIPPLCRASGGGAGKFSEAGHDEKLKMMVFGCRALAKRTRTHAFPTSERHTD